MATIYSRGLQGRMMAAQAQQNLAPRTARNQRSKTIQKLMIAQMLNLRKRGAGGGLGLFEYMFGGPGEPPDPGEPPGPGHPGGWNYPKHYYVDPDVFTKEPSFQQPVVDKTGIGGPRP